MLPDDVRDMTDQELGSYIRKIETELSRLARLRRITPEDKEIRSRHLLDQLDSAGREVKRRSRAEDWQREAQGLRPSEGYGRPGFQASRRDGRLRLIRARRTASLSQTEAAPILDLPLHNLQSLESIEESDRTKAIRTFEIWKYAAILSEHTRKGEKGPNA